jgi:hypothetical protein
MSRWRTGSWAWRWRKARYSPKSALSSITPAVTGVAVIGVGCAAIASFIVRRSSSIGKVAAGAAGGAGAASPAAPIGAGDDFMASRSVAASARLAGAGAGTGATAGAADRTPRVSRRACATAGTSGPARSMACGGRAQSAACGASGAPFCGPPHSVPAQAAGRGVGAATGGDVQSCAALTTAVVVNRVERATRAVRRWRWDGARNMGSPSGDAGHGGPMRGDTGRAAKRGCGDAKKIDRPRPARSHVQDRDTPVADSLPGHPR